MFGIEAGEPSSARQAPFLPAQLAFESITAAGNPLLDLLEAPAVFLNAALNSQYRLIGVNGPVEAQSAVAQQARIAAMTTGDGASQSL